MPNIHGCQSVPTRTTSVILLYWQKDMSYLRLKTVEIGYNFPSKWIDPIHISGLRIYLSGVNLLTFSKFKLWDPEVLEGQGANYPANRIFNFGININL